MPSASAVCTPSLALTTKHTVIVCSPSAVILKAGRSTDSRNWLARTVCLFNSDCDERISQLVLASCFNPYKTEHERWTFAFAGSKKVQLTVNALAANVVSALKNRFLESALEDFFNDMYVGRIQ